ncbi:MAG: McrC family protein [Microthrixaceae bacterium]
MTSVQLAEYRTTCGVELDVDQLRDLAALAPSVTVTPSITQPGHWDLTPGPEVGIVVLGDTTLDIGPKIGIERLMFLIAYVLDPVRWSDQLTSIAEADNPLDVLVPSFVAALRSALGPGILHGYRSIDDSSNVVRGRIRFGDQLRRRFSISAPIEVSFDEFTDDIDENRVLKAALRRLRRLPVRSRRLRRELHHYDRSLAGVTSVDDAARDLPPITWTRLNARYRHAVDLAKLVLRHSSIERHPGVVNSSAFLVNMNDLFEDFVITALREQLQVGHRTLVQGAHGRSLHLDQADRVRLEPDLSWWNGGRCEFVGDCKYKRVNVAGIKHADLYQLLAYTTATGLDEGLLIYAQGEAEPREHVVRFADKRLHVTAVNLSGSPDSILEEIARVGTLINSLRPGTGANATAQCV